MSSTSNNNVVRLANLCEDLEARLIEQRKLLATERDTFTRSVSRLRAKVDKLQQEVSTANAANKELYKKLADIKRRMGAEEHDLLSPSDSFKFIHTPKSNTIVMQGKGSGKTYEIPYDDEKWEICTMLNFFSFDVAAHVRRYFMGREQRFPTVDLDSLDFKAHNRI